MKIRKGEKKKGLDLTREHPIYKRFSGIMDARVKFAIEVNEARNLQNWTQKKLAQEARTTQKMISKIENGDTNIGFDLLNRIAICLNLKLQIGKTLFVNRSEATTSINVNAESKYIMVFGQIESSEHRIVSKSIIEQ